MPTPETLWQHLVDEAAEDAIESAAGVTVTQAEQDLAAAGFDVKAERAHANARIEELTGGPQPTNTPPDPTMDPAAWVSGAAPSPKRSPASRRLVWLVAALVAATTAGGIFYAAAHRPAPPDKPVEAPSATAAPPLQGPPIAPKEQPSSHEKPIAPPEDWKVPPPRPHSP
jgi:hypothetical protein